ncbi:ABC transporter permease subunit [Mesorhizobium sp. M2A.F.Ca.ET.037.01.1.1]|uniref:ABC transporter permease n=2 Tax=Mesorhizobium TaxID=68287 RepID=UPI000F765D17|nr:MULTISPECIES: ABC transporter permease [unclassified Mesorhizobium]RVC70626.1 ABC transporter permease subunit [Mesorhizobium sp. M00.F.Ca.ET.038.03.1.1]RVC73547.1 ABC transporter permease subunit [Mesorhizobium sp. M2A.F.Ca.ET.046.02.1.1]AZO37542.1 ABC transporter permease [Mesorhizobium sp. M2A.F.Ca.ET.046.03.2.1]RUX08966.1 ABC transporter permease subunit [Mesorhizobium sp. M2A.F.Ca.ET.037.01.1.1]RWA86549.1 MAG: ABC transporter permease subunit [Mesorhizobium sp.]
MTWLKPSWQSVLAILLCLTAFALGAMTKPEAAALADPTATVAYPYMGAKGLIIGLLLLAALVSMVKLTPIFEAIVLFVGAHAAAWLLIKGIAGFEGTALAPYFLLLAAAWLLAWRCVALLSSLRPNQSVARNALRLIIPAIFGAWILIIWEAVTRGAGIPFILLPPPSAIGARIANSLPILGSDVRQTIFKAVLIGYVVGNLAGFAIAILADRVPFLRRGLLPIGNMVSALPIIGVAPIMVMWFGFDWPSKAAVVIIMTFFPMLVNTVAGLAASGHMERDLMRTYASGYWPTLVKLRLPAAMPFIFNALKINSTLALIGAIVAEFFGTPVVGMGFRISTEVGRMNIDMVWAEIAVAALAGSVFYGVVALIERAVTFWHPSVRGG